MSYRLGMAVLIVLCGLLLQVALVRAHDEHMATTPDQTKVFEFYRTWMRPGGGYAGLGHRFQSCCNRTDCFPVGEIRKTKGNYYVRLRYPNGELSHEYFVRNEVLESNQHDPRESPDGMSHACVIGGSIVCFVEGSDG